MSDKAVEEIRERRRRLWQSRYGGSVHRFVQAMDSWQKAHPRRVVNLRQQSKRRAVA